MAIVNVQDLSEDQLREMLEDIRLKRTTSFQRKPRKASKKNDLPPLLQGLDEETAAKLVAELKKEGLL